MKVTGGAIAFVLVLLVLEYRSASGYSYKARRLGRERPVFARARAVWHAPPRGLRYRQLGEWEKMPKLKPGTRERVWYVQPNAIRRRILRRTPCPRLHESREVMAVVREASNHINGGSPRMAMKSIGTSEIRVCRKCAGGRCLYAHTKVKSTITLAPTCGRKECKCGFDPQGQEKVCKVSGITKTGMKVSNLTYSCEASRLPGKPRPHKIPTASLPNVVSTTINTPIKATTAAESPETETPLTRPTGAQTEGPVTSDKEKDFDVDMETGGRTGLAPAPILNRGREPLPEESLQ